MKNNTIMSKGKGALDAIESLGNSVYATRHKGWFDVPPRLFDDSKPLIEELTQLGCSVRLEESAASLYPIIGFARSQVLVVNYKEKIFSKSYEPWSSIQQRNLREVLAEVRKLVITN